MGRIEFFLQQTEAITDDLSMVDEDFSSSIGSVAALPSSYTNISDCAATTMSHSIPSAITWSSGKTSYMMEENDCSTGFMAL